MPPGRQGRVTAGEVDKAGAVHLRRAALPAPGGARELAEFSAEVISRPLDRSRPLWEMYVVEGLEGGMIGVVSKLHHAAIDGVSGVEITVNLLDLTPEPMVVPEPDPPWRPDKVPTDLELVGYALASLARQPVRAVKAARRTAEMALRLRRRNRKRRPHHRRGQRAPERIGRGHADTAEDRRCDAQRHLFLER